MLIALPVVFAATACNTCKGEQNRGRGDGEGLCKGKTSVSKERWSRLRSLPRTVEANVVNNISPNLTLRIEKLYAEVGDHVRKGAETRGSEDASNLVQAKLQMPDTIRWSS